MTDIVDRLLADPPAVHRMDASATPVMGAWSTEPDCYRFIARRCEPGSRTLETGSGVSTALFAAIGTRHLCVTPDPGEEERLRAYCERAGIAVDGLTFAVGPSHRVLPTLTEPLDLVLVDGGHGFPTPMIDWFYAGSLLVLGGTLVVDDVHLPAVRTLLGFLRADGRWRLVADTPKWVAFERLTGGELVEDWTEQPFYEPDRLTPGMLARRVARGLARRAREARGRP